MASRSGGELSSAWYSVSASALVSSEPSIVSAKIVGQALKTSGKASSDS
jgi:hypothetical protein